MNTWTPASAASPCWLMNDRNADPSAAAAAQRSSFIRKERRPFCNRFIHQTRHPEGGTPLRPPRTRGAETKERGTNKEEMKQRTNRWKKIKTALRCKQEVKTESIIPLLKNGPIEFDEPFCSFVIFPCFLAPFSHFCFLIFSSWSSWFVRNLFSFCPSLNVFLSEDLSHLYFCRSTLYSKKTSPPLVMKFCTWA